MRFSIACVALTATLLIPSAFTAPAIAGTPQSRSCSERAARVAKAARPVFLAKCKTGSRPAHPQTGAGAQTASAKAVVDPSGVRPAQRSQACTVEADRRGLHDAKLQAFRDHCLAGAAPVAAAGTPDHPDTPTRARREIGEGETAHPH